jgi:hypothetical protein
MANFKKLIGNALNKANSSKPSDDGIKTKSRKMKGMTVKQAEVSRAKGYMEDPRFDESPIERTKKNKKITYDDVVGGVTTALATPFIIKKAAKHWNLPE